MTTLRGALSFLALTTLLTSCGGGGSGPTSSAPISRIEVVPSALVLTALGESKQLRARAVDEDGNEVAATVSWSTTAASKIAVSASGLATAASGDGSAQITATAAGISSAPVLAVATTLPAGAVALTDAQIVGDPVETTPGATASFDNTYEVVLTGVTAPSFGTLLINTEGKAVLGRVRAVEAIGTNTKVTLGLVSMREAFPNLNLEETIDMANATVTINPDIAADYDVKRTGDLFEFTPKAGRKSGTALQRNRPLAAKGTSALPPFTDCTMNLSGGVGSGSIVPISLANQPVFSVKIKPSLDLKYTGANGLERFVVKVAPVIKIETAIGVDAAFEGSVECTVELFNFVIPVGGPLALLVAGQVPVGVGFEAAGKMTLASLGISLKDETSAQLDIGIVCPPGGDCEFVRTLTATNTFTPTVIVPGLQNLRVEPSLTGFGYVETAIGNPFLKALRFKALKAKAGGKIAGSFAPVDSQILDTAYKSDYKVSLEASAGVGVSMGDALKLLGLSKIKALELKISTDIAASPVGIASNAVVADRSSFQTGDTVNFAVHLDAGRLDFFPLLGPYNVNKIVLVRRTGGTSTVVSSVSAVPAQSDFNFAFTSPDSGSAGEFTAFVVTSLLPLDLFSLEIGTATSAGMSITTAALPSATLDQPYTATLAALGGTAPFAWSQTGLPNGLTLDKATGVISGSPTIAGTASVTVDLNSADSQHAQKAFSLKVSSGDTLVGSVSERDSTSTISVSGSIETRQTTVEGAEWTNVRVTLHADGSFTASGTVTETVEEDITTTDSAFGKVCHEVSILTKTGPVTGYVPSEGAGPFIGSLQATTSGSEVVDRTCSDGDNRHLVRPSDSGNTRSRSANTAVVAGAKLVELDWSVNKFTQTGSGASSTTVTGQLKLIP